MKKIICLLLWYFSMISAQAQYTTGSPPAIEWAEEEIYWPVRSLVYSPPPTWVPAKESGEDWFYSVKTRYNNLHEPIGFICAGYSGEPKLDTLSNNTLNNIWLSCGKMEINDHPNDLRLPDTSGMGPPYRKILAGPLIPVIAILNFDGSFDTSNTKDYVWYPTHGLFNHAVQTSDGGYIAAGFTFMSAKFNIQNGQVDLVTPLIPIPYNGNPDSTFESSSCAGWGSGSIAFKPLVVKFNANKTVAWNYIYGQERTPSLIDIRGEVKQVIECPRGGYLIFGDGNNYGAWYKKISATGSIIWEDSIPTLSNIASATTNIENGEEVYYLAGDNGANNRAFVLKLDSAGNVRWTSYLNPSAGADVANNIELDIDGNLMMSGLSDQGYGYIYKLDTAGAVLNSFMESTVISQAQDIRYTCTATSDGGCAIVSSVIRYPIGCSFQVPQNYPGSYTGIYLNPLFVNWNSDAYVAKFDASLNKVWSTSFDAETEVPGGSTTQDVLAACSTCAGPCPLTSWEIPSQDGYDVARRECMFGITEAPDRGLIISGKNSYNLDDSRLVKFECDTVNSARVYTGTITGYHRYKTGAIETRPNYIAASTSRITMDACRYVLYDQVTTLENGSVVTAMAGEYNCCNSIPGGMRIGSGNFSKGELNGENSSTELLGDIKVNIFPNPNNGTFILALESTNNHIASYDIIDSYGKVVASKRGIGIKEQSQMEVILNSFGKGIYAIKLTSEGNTILKKVVIE